MKKGHLDLWENAYLKKKKLANMGRYSNLENGQLTASIRSDFYVEKTVRITYMR